MNPSITMGVAAAGVIPMWKIPLYFAAQLLGAILAAFSVYGVYEGNNLYKNINIQAHKRGRVDL